MKQLLGQLGELWCTTMHTSVMWPFRGKYQCGICHREYAVPFEEVADGEPAQRQALFTRTVLLRRA